MAYAGTLGQRRRHGNSGLPGRLVGMMVGMAVAGLAGAPIAYMLWPAPKAISLDAPSLPITIGGMAFNVPPAAIRFKVQRRPGAQGRVDLSFVWPSLTPPDLSIKPLPSDAPDVSDRLFVTIAASDNTLSPVERLKAIYPRYADAAPIVGADGLSLQGFRDGSPYQGEDLILEPMSPERFLLRCPPGRLDARHVSARAAHRQRRRDGTLSARMAGRLAHCRRRRRSADRRFPPAVAPN